MESVAGKTAIYPGCTLEGTSSGFETSLERVLKLAGVAVSELQQWSCCGASSAHALDHRLNLALSLRNLALAEQQGFDEVVAPCASCYNRLASTNHALLEDPKTLADLNKETGLDYGGKVRVTNAADFLFDNVGAERIASLVKKPLKGLRAACYYGCLNTRIPRMEISDDREYPMRMDRMVEATGAEAINWSYKTECCGAGLFVTSPDTSAGLVARILQDAVLRNADCIVVACPMCQTNLDSKQEAIRTSHGISRSIPVLYISQLIGLAFGLGAEEMEGKQNFVPFESLQKAGA